MSCSLFLRDAARAGFTLQMVAWPLEAPEVAAMRLARRGLHPEGATLQEFFLTLFDDFLSYKRLKI